MKLVLERHGFLERESFTKIVNTSCAVRNISMNNPWALVVPPLREVVTASGPGNRVLTTPADAIAPSICAMNTRKPRKNGTAPIRQRPRVTWLGSAILPLHVFDQLTAGLKRPPEIL
jgi:hypothetical protein